LKAKEQGRKQKSERFNDSEDVYDYEYRLQNAISLVTRSEKISQKDKEPIARFMDLLRALRVSKVRCSEILLFFLRSDVLAIVYIGLIRGRLGQEILRK
jgi:hypothetical protein